jgi:serine/threonine-protein kinase
MMLGVIPNLIPQQREPRARTDASPSAALPPSHPSAQAPHPTQTPPATSGGRAQAEVAPASPLAALTGTWVGNGRELDAVLSGDELEFRVVDPAQFEPQGYEKGEARFALRALPGSTNVFAVEDRIRPIPPATAGYDLSKARGTCIEIWTVADKQPLRATFDGSRLTVEFAKIEPTEANFTTSKGKITSCIGLRKLPASKVVSTLTRPGAQP